MEFTNARKSKIIWSTLLGVFLIALVVHYQTLPSDYWSPVIVNHYSTSEKFSLNVS